MGKLVLTLTDDELLELQQIVLDEDESAALGVLKRWLDAKVPQKGSAPCDSSRLNPYLLPSRGARSTGKR